MFKSKKEVICLQSLKTQRRENKEAEDVGNSLLLNENRP